MNKVKHSYLKHGNLIFVRTLADLIDVFEDAWKGYILAPAQVLLNTPNGDIAAMILLSPYVKVLRQPQGTGLKDNFNRLMRSEWGIGEDDNVVGMTEEEFVNPI